MDSFRDVFRNVMIIYLAASVIQPLCAVNAAEPPAAGQTRKSEGIMKSLITLLLHRQYACSAYLREAVVLGLKMRTPADISGKRKR